MAKAPSIQFYPGDWQRDTGLKMCSLAARGLWAEMMWLMFDGDPYGHLSVKGSVIPPVKLGVIAGVETSVVEALLLELETYGVFSRNEAGVIYSRRMVRDAKRRETNASNGSKGGNPRLSKSVNRKDNRKVIPLTADAVCSINTQERKERAKLPFGSEAFVAAVGRWEKHRKEKRQALTSSTRDAWLAKCASIGEARSIAAIDHSIEKGWTGMYEPDGKQAKPEHSAKREDLKTTWD